MIKISIIMPLYNAEKYLEECLDSILGQVFTGYELICVNDASTDATMKILQDYQKKDNRIQVLTNAERQGAAFSRNRGMSVAQGKYLAFLDGDDIFDEMMLEMAYHKIEEKEADIVMYEFTHVPSDCIHNKLRAFHSAEYVERYCKDTFFVLNCEPYEFIHWTSGPWNKLYKREFIEENRLAFQDLACANDVYFVNMALMLSEKLIVLETENVMVYLRDHSEIGRISSDRDPMCNFKALMQIGQELVRRGKFELLSSCFYYRVYFALQSALLADKREERAKDFYHFLQKEGMRNICSLDKRCYDRLDPYLKGELQQYTDKSFASGWYKEKNILTVFLYKKADRVIDLYERFEMDGKKTAIWGAGNHGRTLLEFCLYHKLQVEAVIDKSADRAGNMLQGYRIVLPQDILDRIQVIVISARFIYDAVVKAVGNRDIEIIDINQFLCLY